MFFYFCPKIENLFFLDFFWFCLYLRSVDILRWFRSLSILFKWSGRQQFKMTATKETMCISILILPWYCWYSIIWNQILSEITNDYIILIKTVTIQSWRRCLHNFAFILRSKWRYYNMRTSIDFSFLLLFLCKRPLRSHYSITISISFLWWRSNFT